MQENNQRGVAIAKGIRGCSLFFFVPVFALMIGIIIGQRYGICLGVLSGISTLPILFWMIAKMINRGNIGLTMIDCLIPVIISLLCGIAFLPISLVAGNLFSPATCIFSGLLLSMGLWAYKSGKIQSPGWLALPFLTFFYEILPIDLPSDLDNLIGLSATTVIEVLAV